MSIKLSSAYKTIGEVVEILNNEEPSQTKINAHTIDFGKKNLIKLNLNFLIIIEDIMILHL